MGYKGNVANAIKHAYAAAELYEFLFHFMGQKQAENMVLWFGTANEYAERIVKFRKPDSFTEVLKDYHNNLSGIVAMQWRLGHAKNKDMLELLIRMADNGILVLERSQNPFFQGRAPEENFMSMADIWLSTHKDSIKEQVSMRLNLIQP